jgi:predicted neuraminidase
VIVSVDGTRLKLFARSTANIGRVCVADSENAGETWTPARPINLPNPNSGIDVVRLADGRLVMIYNHTQRGRTPLNLAVSRDGEDWTPFHVLESAPGEYSYPAIIQGSDGDLHLTYTWNRKKIRYAVYPLKRIPDAKKQ